MNVGIAVDDQGILKMNIGCGDGGVAKMKAGDGGIILRAQMDRHGDDQRAIAVSTDRT